jgi:hypothetical protein
MFIRSNKHLINLIKTLTKKKYQRIFIITGRKSYIKSKANFFFSKLLKKKNYFVFYKKKIFTEIKELNCILDKLEKFKPDLILGVGGGVVIDYAKLSRFFYLRNEIKKKDLFKKYKKFKKLPLFVFPTTAGSGSEATNFSVLYIRGKKFSFENKDLKPNKFFYVINFLKTSHKKNRASSGFDAISQSLESVFSKKSNKKSLKYSAISIKNSLKNYLCYIKKPKKIHLFKMALAAYYSGRAINIAKTNAPHALSYFFTQKFSIEHGHAVALTFLRFVNFYHRKYLNKKSIFLRKRFNFLFKCTNTEDIHHFNRLILNLTKKSGLITSFKKLKIDLKENMVEILSNVNEQRLNNSPIKIFKKDIRNILFDKCNSNFSSK